MLGLSKQLVTSAVRQTARQHRILRSQMPETPANSPTNSFQTESSMTDLHSSSIPVPVPMSGNTATIVCNSCGHDNLAVILSPSDGLSTPVTDMKLIEKFSWSGRRSSNMSPGDVEASYNSLEMEAVSACIEIEFGVKEVHISELLPRTNDLIFVNLTTLEGQAYCLELTRKGWRVCSLRHDSMHGNVQNIELHVLYFESVQSVMDAISPAFRKRFGESLTEKLEALRSKEEADALNAQNLQIIQE